MAHLTSDPHNAGVSAATRRADPCAETDRAGEDLRDELGLALSGGGYRAMLFHLGALIRLNELGLLPKIDRFSAVSGGAIALGALAVGWSRLAFSAGVATNFDAVVAGPLLSLARRTVDVPAILLGLLPLQQPGTQLVRVYRWLFGAQTLQSLPDHPIFVFNATNLGTGVLVRFTKRYLRDYRAGCLPYPEIGVAEAVAASSSFPPYLSPYVLRLPVSLRPTADPALRDPRYRSRLVLSDGGVYDNLALQTLANVRRVLVSDGGTPGAVEPAPRTLTQMLRVLNVMQEQTRALRRHELVRDFELGRREGAIWTVKTDPTRYRAPLGAPPLAVHPTWIARLAAVPTRLAPPASDLTQRLVNWGYAVADTAVRGSERSPDAPPPRWPFPDHGLAAPAASGVRSLAVRDPDES